MKHVHESLPAWLAGELPDERRAAIDEHLAGCGACRAEAERLGELWRGLDAVRAAPGTVSAWPGIRARTFGRERAAWFFGGGALARAGWAAATVAAGLALSLLLPGPATTTTAYAAEDSRLAGLWLEDTGLAADDGADRVSGLWLDAATENEAGGS